MSGLCVSVAKNSPKLLRLLLSVRVNSSTQLYHVRIIAYDKSNEYKYDLCRNESI